MTNFDLIDQYRKKWHQILFNTILADRQVVESSITEIYQQCGLTSHPQIIWAESPLMGYMLFQVMRECWRKTGQKQSIGDALNLENWAYEWIDLKNGTRTVKQKISKMGKTKNSIHKKMVESVHELVYAAHLQLGEKEIDNCGTFFNEFGVSVGMFNKLSESGLSGRIKTTILNDLKKSEPSSGSYAFLTALPNLVSGLQHLRLEDETIKKLVCFYEDEVAVNLTDEKMAEQCSCYQANAYFGSCDAPLCSGIEALLEILQHLPAGERLLRNFCTLSSECGFWLPMEEMVIVSQRPEMVAKITDEDGKDNRILVCFRDAEPGICIKCAVCPDDEGGIGCSISDLKMEENGQGVAVDHMKEEPRERCFLRSLSAII